MFFRALTTPAIKTFVERRVLPVRGAQAMRAKDPPRRLQAPDPMVMINGL
ncbi:hypothetical protein ACPPVV_10605 [Rhodanobacter sp. Col0626]